MSESDRSQRFADAIRQHEEGDSQALLDQFTDGAVLRRPEARRGPGAQAGAPTFWQQYLAEFDEVSSDSPASRRRVTRASWKWRSTGRLASYDTATFVEPAE